MNSKQLTIDNILTIKMHKHWVARRYLIQTHTMTLNYVISLKSITSLSIFIKKIIVEQSDNDELMSESNQQYKIENNQES